jgi:hypothetical protein
MTQFIGTSRRVWALILIVAPLVAPAIAPHLTVLDGLVGQAMQLGAAALVAWSAAKPDIRAFRIRPE